MRRFVSHRTADGGSGARWDYDGPWGPLTVVTAGAAEPTTVDGPQVGHGRIVWDPNDLERLHRLQRGIDVTIGDERIRLIRAAGGFSRRARAISVERSRQSARLRLRRWDTFSLEGTSVLVRGQLWRGRVGDHAEPVDVALFLLVTASILSFEVR